MSTDNQDGLTPAEENIWYRLTTFHGVADNPWSDEGKAIHEKNRGLWNQWALPALSQDRIEALGLAELAPLSEEDCQKIAGELGITELPDPTGIVHMSAIQVSKRFTAAGFVFPRTDFRKAHFDAYANFRVAHFDGDADFSDGNFSSKTSFAEAAFAEPPQFHQATLHQNTSFHDADFSGARDRVNADAESAWRRLKLIMNEAHAHDQELRFFAYEMSVRGRMAQWPVNWLYRLYEGLSDYGRSMGRPAGWLAVLTLLLGLAYGVFLERPADIGPGQFREDIASFTIGNVLPAVGGLNPARRDLYRRLFDDGGGIDIPFTIELLSIFQASGGIVLFFLLSLGIRNRFRIK
ncbi:MAG: pentapeptide repeat-containing protein [Alphaproteobacteria bacterium]|nr:pentapeptide repeat-containing protein [Alphaproteobacteria bacterium]